MSSCPCGSNKSLDACCSPFISGDKTPATPEELMRSRYTAYTQHDIDYIKRTMKAPALNKFDEKSASDWLDRVEWIKLEVVDCSQKEDMGFVEFIAHMSVNKQRHVLHELSEFHRVDGQWFYVDGNSPKIKAPIKVERVGRNDACLCGSGVKYKKCCGKNI